MKKLNWKQKAIRAVVVVAPLAAPLAARADEVHRST